MDHELTKKCKRCFFPRDEPKGGRTCKKCGRREDAPDSIDRETREIYNMGGLLGSLDEMLGSLSLDEMLGEPLWKLAGYPEDPGGEIEIVAKIVEPKGHSPRGASSAKRWMNCPGSTALIKRAGIVDDESEYAAYGTLAHTIAARALDEEKSVGEIAAEYPAFKAEDAGFIQEYVDYVRSRPGRRRVETRHHRPELHPDMYGTVDCDLIPVGGQWTHCLEIVDLKFGEGVYVDAEHNEQGMYYACLVIMEDPTFFPDTGEVIITICQPRMGWAGDAIRSWVTTVGDLKKWLYETLLPAMNNEVEEYKLGGWCQFCPAKLICPKQAETLTELQGATLSPPEFLSDEALGRLYEMWENVKTYGRALTEEARKRLMDRVDVPGLKLTAGRSDRIWKYGDITMLAVERFGEAAYTTPALLSPAQMEKLPGGKDFVAEWAYKPEAGYVVSLASSKKPAVVPKSGAELFASSVQQYLGEE